MDKWENSLIITGKLVAERKTKSRKKIPEWSDQVPCEKADHQTDWKKKKTTHKPSTMAKHSYQCTQIWELIGQLNKTSSVCRIYYSHKFLKFSFLAPEQYRKTSRRQIFLTGCLIADLIVLTLKKPPTPPPKFVCPVWTKLDRQSYKYFATATAVDLH